MARFLFAWELGAGSDHLNRLLPTARRLRALGHAVLWAVKDVMTSSQLLEHEDFRFVQAPLRPQRRAREAPVSLSDILATLAYDDPRALAGQLRSWLDLYDLAMPDAVIGDFSPTALLAARIKDLPTGAFGNGFEIPPGKAPLPVLQPWRSVSHNRLVDAEHAILSTVNAILAGHGVPVLNMVAELFHGQDTFLCTFPEFDHFGPRTDERYCGPIIATTTFPAAAAKGQDRQELCFDLSGAHPHTRGVLQQLAAAGRPAFGHVNDMPAGEIARFRTPTLDIPERPLDLGAALSRAGIMIGHGDAGTATQAILAGLPLLLLPHTIEQALLAYRLTRAGLALTVRPLPKLPSLAAMLARLQKPEPIKAAGLIAARYADFDSTAQQETIAARCAALVAGQ